MLKAGKCKHYTGLLNSSCSAGVRYDSFTDGIHIGLLQHIPCFAENNEAPACARQEFPTPEELAEAEVQLHAHMAHNRALATAVGGNGNQHHVLICLLCDPWQRFEGRQAWAQHLRDSHAYAPPIPAELRMASHMDAATWYQTDTCIRVNGQDIGYESVRAPRRGADRALWGDDQKQKQKRKKQ